MAPTKLKRRRGYSRLSGKRQITLPLSVVQTMGLGPGDVLRVETLDGQIVLIPEEGLAERRQRAVELAAGSMTGLFEPGYLSRLRDEWR